MNELFRDSLYAGVTLSLAAYMLGVLLKKRFRLGIFNPLLISIAISIVVLLLGKIDYEVYNDSAKYLGYLLTPATVCLAIPLYEQWELLKKNYKAVLLGLLAGAVTSLTTVFVLSLVCGLSHEEYVTFLPKSVTTAIGMGISEDFGAASHAIGTSKAIELGDVEGAMSGLAIAVSGIITVVLAPVFARLI